MKITKLQVFVHIIIAVVFTIIFLLVTRVTGSGKAGVWIFTMFTLCNTLFLCLYINKTHKADSNLLDYSLFLPPLVAYPILIVIAALLEGHINTAIYVAIVVLILGVSVFMQGMMIAGRKRNIAQEVESRDGRLNRDELADVWGRLSVSFDPSTEQGKLAKEIETEIRYADPLSIPEVNDLENRIREKTKVLQTSVEEGNYEKEDIFREEKEILGLVKDRNTKLKRMK